MNTSIQAGYSAKRRITDPSRVMVVVIEHGGEWCRQCRPEAGTDLVLIAQVPGEDHLVFARRVLKKLVTLVEQGAEVVAAAVAVAAALDIRRLEARCLVARAALRAFREGVKSELQFLEPTESNSDCRSHLTAIAEGLLDGAKSGSSVTVRYQLLGKPRVPNRMRILDS